MLNHIDDDDDDDDEIITPDLAADLNCWLSLALLLLLMRASHKL